MLNENEANFAANQAVLNNFRSNPTFSTYWKNWERCQNWASQCQQTFEEFQRNIAWQKAQDDINLMLNGDEGMEVDEAGPVDMKEEEFYDDGYAEFARQSQEHKRQRELERARAAAAEAAKHLVEYVDASDIGIHGVVSKDISVKVFGQERADRLEAMQAKYGPHAERILTLEVGQNYKFDQIVSKHNAQLWPNIPLHLPTL
uniref:LsmAD domain-containing protein n=1 Tax=Panagrellus redivivus TaxID=6233 RepID=A0A7E4ZR49_PANRE